VKSAQSANGFEQALAIEAASVEGTGIRAENTSGGIDTMVLVPWRYLV
jgi:hypothetical protein